MEQITNSLRESKAARWGALGIVAFTMLCGYFITDAMSPLKPMLESQLLWNSTDYGIFTSAYGWFNVFAFMLILGGILLDKMGVRFTAISSAGIMIIGAAIKYWAISSFFPSGMADVLGMKSQVFFAALGFAIFGVGVEIAGITVSRIIVKWFKGKELALAMGLEMATARMGTLLATAIPLPIAKYFGDVSMPILFGVLLLVIGLISFFVYAIMDKKLEASEANMETEEEEPFKLADVLQIISNKGFWLISLLCVLFYSAVFPWIKFATDLVINKYQISPDLAGAIPSVLPLGTLFLTPFFGNLYDRKGKGATIMIIGAFMLIFVHAIFSVPFLDNWILALFTTVVLGVALSLVPSAMWPSVPKIIPEKQLGTAYALTFWIQNWGLMGVPLLVGIVLNTANPNVPIAKETVKKSIETTYQNINGKIEGFNLDEIQLGKVVDVTTTNIINKVLVDTAYEPATGTDQYDAIQNELSQKNINDINALTFSADLEKNKEAIEKVCLENGYKILTENKMDLRYNYTLPNLVFLVFGVLALIVAFMLKAEDKKKQYGLELPNIQQ